MAELMLTDLLHNIVSAGDGWTHPSVAVAATYAMARGMSVEAEGGTPQEIADAYKYGFGMGLGWSPDETDLYWKILGDDPHNVQDETIDAWDVYLHAQREDARWPVRAAAANINWD